MSVYRVPTELLDNICLYLAPAHLAALAVTSSRFCHVAQRRLYRHVSLNSRNLTCVFTLANNPHLAHLVRSFAIRIGPYSNLLAAFYRKLATALSNMPELTSLEVCVDKAASWIMRTPAHSTYHRLRRFISSFHLDDNLAHFLDKADGLLELEIDPVYDPLSSFANLRQDALSNLSQFTGSSLAAQHIVPGRPVEHIHLNSGDLTEDVAQTLSKSTAPITILLAETTSHSVSLIGTLTRCMEHLAHLRIMTTYNFSDVPDSLYFANIADALTSLPDLQSCEIWGIHWISSKKNFRNNGKVWESPSFDTSSSTPPNTLLANGGFLDDLYSNFAYAY